LEQAPGSSRKGRKDFAEHSSGVDKVKHVVGRESNRFNNLANKLT